MKEKEISCLLNHSKRTSKKQKRFSKINRM